MSYFTRNYAKLSFPIGKPGFRPAQLAAIQSVSGHFFGSNLPAIVVMPTGSGKTTVAAALAFTLQAQRVLVITPSRLLREQISEKMATLVDLESISALELMAEKPKVKNLATRVSAPEDWEDLREFDVVVSTVHSISSVTRASPDIPDDLFDLVIIDEGHHAPAAIWSRALERLQSARQVLLTATPFRRDAKEIKGRIVFSYDIRRAFDDGVFGRLSFQAAWPNHDETADEAIARETEARFKEDRSAGLKHLVMVRVDSIERGRSLEGIYKNTTLRLRFISGQSALSTVKRTTRDLLSGTLDGIICVNMYGEGFDLPRLKIAALHSPHKSLAVTLQFIGRFARTSDPEIGEATFVAFPEEQDNELRELWTSGAPWPDFIHNLSAARIEAETTTRETLESFDINVVPELTDLSLTAIQPYFHVKVFHCPSGVDLGARVDLGFNENVVFRATSDISGATVTITQSVTKPRWTSDTRIMNVGYDLDILHYNAAHKKLFICSTRKSPDHYRRLSAAATGGHMFQLSASEINRVLNDLDGLQFFSVGMRKRQFGGRGETYRTLAGPVADLGVDEIDGQYYDRGHSFGKGRSDGKDVTIGISASSKIWSNTARLVPEFVVWCDTLATKIGSGVAKPTGSGIDRLSAGEPIDEIGARVLFGMFSSKTYIDPPIVYVGDEPFEQERGSLADFAIEIVEQSRREIRFRIVSPTLTWDGVFSLDHIPLISAFDTSEEEPRVGRHHSSVPISDYLSELPPRFYLESMSAIEGPSLFPPPAGSAELDKNDFTVIDWSAERVDITVEKPREVEIKSLSVFTWLDNKLRASGATFVFNDDGPNEIADFVALEEIDGTPVISLYHCKASSKALAGSRVDDLYEVCGQAIRCGVWLAGRRLLEQVDYRYKSRGGAALRKGDLDVLRRAFWAENRQKLKFRLVIVQPGLSEKKVRQGPHQLLIASKNYAKAAAFDIFEVMCSG